MIKAIICDFDGTIVHSLPLWTAVYERVLQNFNVQVEREVLVKMLFDAENITLDDMGIDNPEAFREQVMQLAYVEHSTIELMPHAVDLLHAFPDAKFALVSNSPHHMVETYLFNTGLLDRFETVLGADSLEHRKPHPEPLLKACEACGVKPQEAVFVGDTPGDVRCAKAAGVYSILLTTAENAEYHDFESNVASTTPRFAAQTFEGVIEHIRELDEE